MAAGNLIDGRAIAEQIHAETAQRVTALTSRGVQAGLVFVRVGEDPASKVYVGMKARISARLGEGVINGILTARVGIAAIDVCRPLPFVSVKSPRLSDIVGELMRKAERPESEVSPG